ncbi:Sua5/YciO/YrdC/YwlC family protein [Candidatus Gracilibacteria bacterium]|nr:Sua5/YciO/YrdC/YwlC family protein [Candidatus Gracilibacteria bacterium]
MKFNLFFIATDTCYGLGCPMNDHNSYRKIYKIKKRTLDKPLALLVESFSWLEKNTDLTHEQIEFLKKYPNPFTILTDSLPVHHWMNYEDDEVMFENRDRYERIAFRVAHTPEQEKLLKKHGPLFLTSANESGEPEMYNKDDIFERFNYNIEKYKIEFIGTPKLDPNISPSDIFEFVGDTIEVKYLRKK